jgi:hypothetical protein
MADGSRNNALAVATLRVAAQYEMVVTKSRVSALIVAALTVIGFATVTNAGFAGAVFGQRAAQSLGRPLAELAGSGIAAWDWFGASVAVSSSTIVVGAPAAPLLSAGFGQAYVFAKTAKGWQQQAQLENPDTMEPDWFGYSVAVSGSTVVVGAPAISVLSSGLGRAYVFTKTVTGWRQSVQLEGPDTAVGDWFGDSVAISGGTIVVGAPSHASKAGAAYVFTDSGKSWQATELKGSDTAAKDDFGASVAVSGNTIVVGAFGHAAEAGRAYVFTKRLNGWHQAAELSGSSTVAGDGFGVSVAVAGRTIAVGAGLAASDSGRAYVFTKTATGWHQSAQLAGSGPVDKDDFGDAVAVSGDTVVVGTFAQAPAAGRAYVFKRTAIGWHQAAALASGSSSADGSEFGLSVAISGDTIAVGAQGEESGAGRAFLFEA